MDDQQNIPSFSEEITPTKRRNTAFIVVLVLFGILLIVALINKNRSSRTPANVPTSGSFIIGETVVINYNSTKFDTSGLAVIAVDTNSLNEFVQGSQTGTSSLDTLFQDNKLFTTPNGTKARIVISQQLATKVRIIGGDAQGKEGWVNNAFIYR